MNKLIVGIATVRSGMQTNQRSKFEQVLKNLSSAYDLTVLHGDAKGGDEIAHSTARKLNTRIELYPTDSPDMRAFCESADITHDASPFLQRFSKIADNCDVLIACPSNMDEKEKSGVWNTVNNVLYKGKKVYLITPRGHLWVGKKEAE